MTISAHSHGNAIHEPKILAVPQHSVVVRVTHWLNALSFFALVASGGIILIAHPRFYWGEAGAWGAPPIIQLPIPAVLGFSGWGRYLHFLSAWVCFLSGVAYVIAGLFVGHFRRDFLPEKGTVAWRPISRIIAVYLHVRRPASEESARYNVLQRLTYIAVVFVLFPLVFLTGLAMSPGIASAFPFIVKMFAGEQSARTVHFFLASALVVFLIVHLIMISLTRFSARTGAMIVGRGKDE
jgi:thiosulfate reductase cytochrome b subunit